MRTPSPGPGKGWRKTISCGSPSARPSSRTSSLNKFAQRLQQLQVQRVGQAADVVVRLDGVRLLGLCAGRFDHVRIDRALGQPFRIRGVFAASRWNTSTNSRPMILRLASGSVTPASVRGTRHVASTWMTLTPQMLGEGFHHLCGLVQPQQAGIDEYAGQLLADGAMDERRGDGGIDAAGQAENDFFLADCSTDARDRLVDVVRHVPVAAAAADVVHEALQ